MVNTQAVGSTESLFFKGMAGSTKKAQKDNVSFSDFLDTGSSAVSSKDSSVESTKAANNNNVTVAKEAANKMNETNTSDKVTKVTSEARNVDNADDLGVDEKLIEAVIQVKEAVLKSLDITEEELISILENLGASMIDLLNPAVLAQVVMENTGTDNLAGLLLDDEASQQLTDIISVLNQTVEKLGISKEQLENAADLVKVADNKEENVSVKQITVSDEEKNQSEVKENTSFDVEIIKEDNHKDTKDNNSSDKSLLNPAEQFLQKLQGVQNTSQAEGTHTFSDNLREIAMQVIEQVRVNLSPEKTSMEIQLNPESLGKVMLNITSKHGVMTAQLFTQNEVAKEAIESQIQVLKENLEKQGLKVEAIEVTVAQFEFDQNRQAGQENSQSQQNTSSKKNLQLINDMPADEEDEAQTELLTVADGLNISGSSVDYSA